MATWLLSSLAVAGAEQNRSDAGQNSSDAQDGATTEEESPLSKEMGAMILACALGLCLLLGCCELCRRRNKGKSSGTYAAVDQSTGLDESLVPRPAPQSIQETKHKLEETLGSFPYLKDEKHYLNFYVLDCQKFTKEKDADAAQDSLERLQMLHDREVKKLAGAFARFDENGDDSLTGDEIIFMMKYLGFPHDKGDVETLLKASDKNNNNAVELDEFEKYVGQLGGSEKLFEVRAQKSGDVGGDVSAATRRNLQECGIEEDAEAYWRLVLGDSELSSAANMVKCQRAAIKHIRGLAQENHSKALPELLKRVRKLGFSDNDLRMTLAWIREVAPILIHVNLDTMLPFFEKDTHYRNQFETGKSRGLLDTSARTKWERNLFGDRYRNAKPFERPKYGVQNIWNDYRGVLGCEQYGESYLILKDVRLRCTFAPEDSANLPARRLSVPDFYAHVLMEYTDKELKETLRVASNPDSVSGVTGDSKKVIEKWGKYKEAQIHGEVNFRKHVDRLVAHEKHRSKKDRLQKLCDKLGWKLTFMTDMKKLQQERGEQEAKDMQAWREKFALLHAEEPELRTDDLASNMSFNIISNFTFGINVEPRNVPRLNDFVNKETLEQAMEVIGFDRVAGEINKAVSRRLGGEKTKQIRDLGAAGAKWAISKAAGVAAPSGR